MKIVMRVVGALFAIIQFFVAVVTPMPKGVMHILLGIVVTLWLIRDWRKSKVSSDEER